ncbi:MAG: hypothetical protein HY774_27260 [Acidobacteria bacterium]|nr:hypothetical protein [Acidobacteriota bacterium]
MSPVHPNAQTQNMPIFPPQENIMFRSFVSSNSSLLTGAATIAHSLGLFLPKATASIWIHGTSIEAFQSARSLIFRLQHHIRPGRWTFTGIDFDTLKWLQKRYIDDFVYLPPVSVSLSTNRFFQSVRPQALVILGSGEGLSKAVFSKACQQNIPVIWTEIDEMVAPQIQQLWKAGDLHPAHSRFGVQTSLLEEQLQTSGIPAPFVSVTGSLQYEFDPEQSQLSRKRVCAELGILPESEIVVAPQIHPGEEQILCEAVRQLRWTRPFIKLVLVVYSDAQLQEIHRLLSRAGVTAHVAGEPGTTPDSEVVICPTSFDSSVLTYQAQVVLVGGSFVPNARTHNPIAAVQLRKPVVAGPYLTPLVAATRQLLHVSVIQSIDQKTLTDTVEAVLSHPETYQPRLDSAHTFVRNLNGAAGKLFGLIQSSVEKSSPQLPARNKLAPTVRDQIGQSRAWKLLAQPLTKRRIPDLDALRQRLGNPETILCLGNGPSSEDPAVFDVQYDALFRVNHLWQQRGRLVHPDVVFVGTPDTLKKVRPCIYGFSSVRKEYGMLLRNLWTSGLQPIAYCTVERLCNFQEYSRTDKLSNGTLMVMVAAALRPKRLIIGGIDLYRHPDGRYPGDFHASNNYAPVHDRNTELDVITTTLRDFPNELVIIGDVLRQSLIQSGINIGRKNQG